MLTLNEKIFTQVVQTALSKVHGDHRWTNAILRGAELLRTTGWCEAFEDECGHIGIMIVSPDSGKVYQSNGECWEHDELTGEKGLCKAFEHGKPCKHRAAAGLYRRYIEAVEAEKAKAVQAARDLAAARARYETAVREMEELFA